MHILTTDMSDIHSDEVLMEEMTLYALHHDIKTMFETYLKRYAARVHTRHTCTCIHMHMRMRTTITADKSTG
jgi:hypothetical protein